MASKDYEQISFKPKVEVVKFKQTSLSPMTFMTNTDYEGPRNYSYKRIPPCPEQKRNYAKDHEELRVLVNSCKNRRMHCGHFCICDDILNTWDCKNDVSKSVWFVNHGRETCKCLALLPYVKTDLVKLLTLAFKLKTLESANLPPSVYFCSRAMLATTSSFVMVDPPRRFELFKKMMSIGRRDLTQQVKLQEDLQDILVYATVPVYTQLK